MHLMPVAVAYRDSVAMADDGKQNIVLLEYRRREEC